MKMSSVTVRFLIMITGLVAVVSIGVFYLFFRRVSTAISCQDCNIIYIQIDPLRADAIQSMGGLYDGTPVLDGLVQHGFAFTNAIAASPWTLPSAMSVMTGVYPSRHGVINKEVIRENERDGIVAASLKETAPHLTNLVSLLRTHGYATGGFAGGAALDPSYGFNEGFDVYQSPGDFEDIASSSAQALSFIDKHKHEKFFLLLHGFDVHGQYMPPNGLDRRYVSSSYNGSLTGSTSEQKELREQGVRQGSINITDYDAMFLRAIYQEKVSLMDKRIGEFLRSYNAMDIQRKTIIVFSSNHGDEFYEHGRIDHGMTLYDEVLRIPLIIVIPGYSKGKQIAHQIRNIDIMPTILAIVGVPLPPSIAKTIDGVSLIPLMQGNSMQLTAISETQYRYATFQTGIRSWDGWKLIFDREQHLKRLYHVSVDPEERNDRYAQQEAKEQPLINALLQYINDSPRLDN